MNKRYGGEKTAARAMTLFNKTTAPLQLTIFDEKSLDRPYILAWGHLPSGYFKKNGKSSTVL
jgi:hypothetical protein